MTAENIDTTTTGELLRVRPENFILASLRCLKKEPLPKGMTSRELVSRAIEFRNPPRLPYYFLFHPNAADIALVGPLSEAASQPTKLPPKARYTDAWGVTWEVTGRNWDHAVEFPLSDLHNLESYKLPDFTRAIKSIGFLSWLGNRAGKYILASNPVNLFERMRALMGFEELMMAPYTQPDGLHRLLERLTVMTIESIQAYAGVGGFHGFISMEDWGLQTSLQVKVDTFREFYKPYYQRIVDACHQCAMHFFWHNCGYIIDMLPDMIELGVDVLQLDQPRLMGHQALIDQLGGKLCMWNTVDIQWSADADVSDADIRHEVAEMLRIYHFQTYQGGFIAKHYPSPWDINLPPARQRLIYDAFMESGHCSL
jgi:hypothetical protein